MKKICILSNGLWRGGTDTFIVNLVNGLDKDKYDITVVLSISDEWLAAREPEIISSGAKTYRTYGVTGKGIIGRLKHLFLLFQYLNKEKPDVFQTNLDLFNGPNLLVAWLAGVPIRICHSHNSMQQKEVLFGKKIWVSVYQNVMRWMCWHFSNRRAGCSREALDFLFVDRWKEDPRAMVVNNGIDIELFRNGIDKTRKLSALGINAPQNIITVGRISLQKNPGFIAKVFIELCNIRTDCDLIWVGIGDMEERVKATFSDAGVENRVHFMGTRDDVNELMQCSDAFLFPSVFEGLGIVVIEAQAAGLPALVSDTVPYMADCGGCEFLSLDKTAREWAEHLNDILNGKTQLKVSEEKLMEYSVDNMVHQMEILFD